MDAPVCRVLDVVLVVVVTVRVNPVADLDGPELVQELSVVRGGSSALQSLTVVVKHEVGTRTLRSVRTRGTSEVKSSTVQFRPSNLTVSPLCRKGPPSSSSQLPKVGVSQETNWLWQTSSGRGWGFW